MSSCLRRAINSSWFIPYFSPSSLSSLMPILDRSFMRSLARESPPSCLPFSWFFSGVGLS
jgi:hypothetical protein